MNLLDQFVKGWVNFAQKQVFAQKQENLPEVSRWNCNQAWFNNELNNMLSPLIFEARQRAITLLM